MASDRRGSSRGRGEGEVVLSFLVPELLRNHCDLGVICFQALLLDEVGVHELGE